MVLHFVALFPATGRPYQDEKNNKEIAVFNSYSADLVIFIQFY